jgi:hypothetical protein
MQPVPFPVRLRYNPAPRRARRAEIRLPAFVGSE